MPPSSGRRRCRARREKSVGTTTLPLDFDIFFRSGSRMQPEIATLLQGTCRARVRVRTTVEKSHVRMISCAWGRRSIGKTREKRSGPSTQRPAICGVSEDVAQVSMTSGSPMKPPGCPRWSSWKPGGDVGRRVDRQLGPRARIGRSSSTAVCIDRVPDREGDAEEALAGDVPVAGQALDPRLVAGAHESGCHSISRPASISWSRRSIVRTYHCARRRSRAGARPSRRTSRGG